MTKTTCYLCGAACTSADPWDVTCQACKERPTISYNMKAYHEGERAIHVLDGRTVDSGRTREKHPNCGIFPREWFLKRARELTAQGYTVELRINRHTRRLGWTRHGRTLTFRPGAAQ